MSTLRIFLIAILLSVAAGVVRRLLALRTTRALGPAGAPVVSLPTTLTPGLARISTVVLLGLGMILMPALVLGLILTVAWMAPGGLLAVYAATATSSLTLVFWGRVRARRSPAARVEVFADRVRIPFPDFFISYNTVPFEQILSLDLRGGGVLVIDTAGGPFAIGASQLLDPPAIVLVRDAIAFGLRRRPGSEEVLARGTEQARTARDLMSRPIHATRALVAVLVAVFIVELLAGLTSNTGGTLLRLGAVVPHAAWYRFFSASFLHVDFFHILMNLACVLSFGALLERALGPARFLNVYLLSGIAGAGAASLVDPIAAGASTSAFGLIGALAVLQLRHGQALPPGFRLPVQSWVMLIGINAALPIFISRISWAGHAGGLAAGTLVALLMTHGHEIATPRAPLAARLLAVALVVAHIVAFGAVFMNASRPEAFEQALLDIGVASGDGGALNNRAWQTAVDPAATPAALREAKRLAQQAVDQAAGDETRDTLAQTLYRLGEYDAAIEIEKALVRHGARRPYVTQLGRFLAARRQSGKPALVTALGVHATAIGLSLGSTAPAALLVTLKSPPTAPLLVYALAGPHQLIEACVPAGPPAATSIPLTGAAISGTPELVYAAVGDCHTPSARALPADDPAILELP